jgi:uncharacterized membrane protein
MTKIQFVMSLQDQLAGLPRDELEQRLEFYSEMIDDRIEEGMTEAEAVEAIGSVEDIVAQIIAETPLVKIAKEKIRPKRRLKTWEILLLVLGSPLWLPLLVAVGAVILAVYASAWSVIVSLWAAFGALIASAVAGLVEGIALACLGHLPAGMLMLASGMVCAGSSILMFYGCKASTKGILLLTKKMALWLKNRFMKKEAAV